MSRTIKVYYKKKSDSAQQPLSSTSMNSSAFKGVSKKNETRRNKQFEIIYVKKENTSESCSTEPSATSLKEEVKQDILSNLNFGWERSLKKVSKEEAERNKASTPVTVVVTVKKTLPPREPEVVEWPLKSDEQKPRRSQGRWKKVYQPKESQNDKGTEPVTEPSTASVSTNELEKLEVSQTTAWASPLKKASKEESENKSNFSRTVTVRVQKILPKEPEIEVWPLKAQSSRKSDGKKANSKANTQTRKI